MPRFRKKPVLIEAEQFNDFKNPPKGVTAWPDERGFQPRDMTAGFVTTIHGQRAHVMLGDWIIPEPDGVHYYPVKDNIFKKTYDVA